MKSSTWNLSRCAALVAIMLPLMTAPAWAQEGGASLDVMSFNIRYNNPGDSLDAWPERSQDVATLIRYHAPHAVGLQEALRGQLDDLARALPEYAWLGEGRSREERGNEYSAILYRRDRLRVVESGTFWLSETPDAAFSRGWDAALERIATWARFEVLGAEAGPGGGRVAARFVHLNTHFDHRGEQARLESARLIAAWTKANAGDDPVVVTGDLNTLPGSPPVAALTETGLLDAFTATSTPHYGPTGTWNGFRAIEVDRRIDYIFVDARVRVEAHAILPGIRPNGRFASDHLPVLAHIRF